MALNVTEFTSKLWESPQEMQKFTASPKQYLLDQGEPVPGNAQVHAHVDTLSVRNFVLPANKSELPEGDNPVLNVTRKAMDDSAFKTKLKEHPKEAAAEEGLQIPQGVVVNVYENTPTEFHVVVPFNPAKAELSDADLEAVAGGKGTSGSTDLSICGGTATGAAIGCGVATFFSLGTSALASGVAGAASGITSGSLYYAKD